jgi:knotted carbamoyltransferase YgeW
VTWAYSPSYGKPLSCPQSLISLLPRFGMNVTLAHPEGYDLMPELVEKAKVYSTESGATFAQTNSMAEAFEGADIVIPKSWASYAAMERRTKLYAQGDDAGINALEQELLAQNATHQDWCSTQELMATTAKGDDTIFMHPLPADISGVSCEHGEVMADVFDLHRDGMYKEASYKPYAIAAMVFLQKAKDPAATLAALEGAAKPRWHQA